MFNRDLVINDIVPQGKQYTYVTNHSTKMHIFQIWNTRDNWRQLLDFSLFTAGCLYNGQLYVQNQQWEDKCATVCTCNDASTGIYACRERYYRLPFMSRYTMAINPVIRTLFTVFCFIHYVLLYPCEHVNGRNNYSFHYNDVLLLVTYCATSNCAERIMSERCFGRSQ